MPLIIALIFFISSCANLNFDRAPASNASITDDDVAKVFEFERSSITNNVDNSKSILQLLDGNIDGEIAVEFVEDLSLPTEVAFHPEFQIKENKYKIIIHHSKEALNDPVASGELFDFLKKISDHNIFRNQFAAFEMYYNAQAKNPSALHGFTKIRSRIYERIGPLVLTMENSKSIAAEMMKRSETWKTEETRYESFVKQDNKVIKEKDAARRAVIDTLDKASEDEQFKTLVANNDRKGVSKLLKQYLPWEQMAPFEKKYWENHLNIIENPLPLNQRVLVYRGINDDMIYTANEAGQALENESAYKDGKIFLMSAIMTKNQGTWNRRLRSLTAMNEKYIASGFNGNTEFAKSARITTMFKNHSVEPIGSPFLSLTPNLGIAHQYGFKKLSAYLLDPRAMSYNYASEFKDEVEYLVPLMIFPDEVVFFYDVSIHKKPDNLEEMIKKVLKEKLVNAYGATQGESLNDKILKNTEKYFYGALSRFKRNKTGYIETKEPNMFQKMFSSILEKKPAAAPMGQSCMDLVSQFWK